MTDTVLFEERIADNGARIAVATLNAPDTLNGLSLTMVDLLDARLRAWARDPMVAVVVLQGSGNKAFCAGGDLHALYTSMRTHAGQGPWANRYARDFFEREYRLDFLIHAFPKPILCWGHGIVMGGGIGLMMGASHRVVSEASRLAMPEIGIGLFPDVGGSWLLNQMPGRTGLFLALTGAVLNTADAFFAGLADFRLASTDWPAFMEALLHQPWASQTARVDVAHVAPRSINDGVLKQILLAHEPAAPLEPGPLQRHAFMLNGLCSGKQLEDVYKEILALQTHADPWLARAARALAAGAPGSVRLAFSLLQHMRSRSLDEVFRAEYIAALACASAGDFAEGIRALLIDKDKCPRWNPVSLAAADAAWLRIFFAPPWPQNTPHPLADLGPEFQI